MAACGDSHPQGSTASAASLPIRYADCMRAHGVPDFPDPGPGGVLTIGGTGINRFSASFESAGRACAKLHPGGNGPPPAMTEAQRRSALRFAVGTVADLDTVTAFFVGLGLEVEGRTFVEGEFVDTVIGIPGSRSHIVMLRPPGGGPGLELSSFVWPDHGPGSPTAMANELGLRNVAFEVDDLQATVNRLAADGYGLVGGIGQYENIWRMAYVRGPEGIIVSLAERIG